MKKRVNIGVKKSVIKGIIGLVSIIFIIIIVLYETQIMKFIESMRNEYLDYIFLSVSFASNIFLIFFFLTTIFLWKEHKRRWIFPLWMSFFLSAIISYLIKIIVRRPRPFETGTVSVLNILFYFMRNNFNKWNFSFPSFQAVLVFAAIPILNKEFKKFRYVWIIFAFLVGFSRVYFGAHYLSDLLAGAAIGYLIGYLMVVVEEKYGIGLKIMKSVGIAR